MFKMEMAGIDSSERSIFLSIQCQRVATSFNCQNSWKEFGVEWACFDTLNHKK